MAKPLVIPVFIPHMGCGHTCVFCNQRKIAGEFDLPTAESLATEVRVYRESCRNLPEREVQLAFYGGSFTGLPEGVQETLLAIGADLKARGLIAKIRLSTRPDYINPKVIARLLRYGVDIVELGVQSLVPQVLLASKRGHTAGQVAVAVALLRATDLQLGLQMMVALPEDTPERSLWTAKQIVDFAPDFVRIYPTAVIKDTELAKLWQAGRYRPWPMVEIIDTVADILLLFRAAQIPVIRIGLQATDRLVYGQELLAGAYHPAMGELVQGRIFRRQMEEKLLLADGTKGGATILCHPQNHSQVIGQKKCNLHYFQAKYGLSLKIVVDQTIAVGECQVQVEHSLKGDATKSGGVGNCI